MRPETAARVLQQSLTASARPMTVADASVASGLALRDTEAGLHWLTSEYRGHLRVTEDGDIVHVFPDGFSKPWETRERAWEVLGRVFGMLVGVGRLVVRAWLLIAMVAYAAIFVVVLLGLAMNRESEGRSSGFGVGLVGGLFRGLGDALFWTLHPWSPLYVGTNATGAAWLGGRARVADNTPKVPFYERVNRFVFGPSVPKPDPHEMRRRILQEIRRQRGRVGLADVMRVTGLPRGKADPLMARLMLDYDGTVDVGELGGILYRFESLRRTAASVEPRQLESPNGGLLDDPARRGEVAAWNTPATLPPLTGNGFGVNLGIALLNGFNLLASAWVINSGLTIRNILALLTSHRPPGAPPLVLPDDGLPIALGVIPFVFSLVLFVLPLVRAVVRLHTKKQVAQENARLGILREVLARAPQKQLVADESLRSAYRIATGSEATSKEITAQVVMLGGDVEVGPAGQVRYRFADLEVEAEALEVERAQASADEAKLGRIVFASDEPLSDSGSSRAISDGR